MLESKNVSSKIIFSHPYKKWLYAAKPASWPKILVPFFLGHAMGAYQSGTVNWAVLLFTFLAVVAGVVFIVYMNDWGDQRVDKIKREMFPDGCSPKTIPDKILSAKQLLAGGIVAGILGFAGVVVAGFFVANAEKAFYFGAICCATFVVYTLPPVKLNYRGGGEVLEMLGVGIFLPLFMALLQSGTLISQKLYAILFPFALLALSSAVASGLSDEQSDIAGGKNTFVTFFGNKSARLFIEVLVIVSVFFALLLAKFGYAPFPASVLGLVQLLVIYFYLKMRKVSKLAVSNAFKEQKVYKLYLHQAIWWSATITACMLFMSIY